ncbi:MAG TPA: diguanylate cyclase, partial [Oxalicibacterium sp.]|nr:diguanylate cyclase [Oxalicibacterium sp.]
MRIDGKFLRSRVARRIATLFFIAAVVPTSLLAVLTYRDISRVEQQQHQAELVDASRSYAMGMYDRLLFAHRIVDSLARQDATQWPFNAHVPIFDSIVRIGARDAEAHLGGGVSFQNEHFPMLLLRPAAGKANGVDVFLAAPAASAPTQIVLAQLNPHYLWGDAEDINAAFDICIYNNTDRLHCSYPDDRRQAGADAQRGQWDLFLKAEFGVPAWTVIATRRFAPPATHSDFFNLYLGVAASAVLLIILLSLVQIRRTMVPLERLIEGTGRIAEGDFSDIVVDSRDEFADLTAAVNTMSRRIQRQLSTLHTLSNMYNEMRDSLDLPQMITVVGDAMRQRVPGATLYVLRLSTREQEADRLFVHRGTGAPVTESTLNLQDHEIKKLTLHACGMVDAESPFFVRGTSGMRSWSIALMWHGRPCGFLSLAWQGPVDWDEDIDSDLQEFASRMAIAIQIEDREQRLLHQALFDSLTGLLNRHGLEEQIAQIESHDSPAAVLFVDIDRFKYVNDNFGHKIGDVLLQAIAVRLREFTECGIAARLGGDEFVLLLPGKANTEQVAASATALMAMLTRPFFIASEQFLVTCSIGIAMHPAPSSDRLTLIEQADIAMYRAKQSGRNNYCFYDERMSVENHERLALEVDLRQALQNEEFVLHYQPRVDLKTGNIVGVEALLRWQHPGKGMVQPAQFIGLAEETGLIVPLGSWVLRNACAQHAAWRRLGLGPMLVAVNVSTRQFSEPDFVKTIAAILAETGRPADCLELELTESMVMDE